MKLEWRLLVAGQVVGLALLLVGWVQASGELQPEGQIRWLNLGVAGATIAVAAGVRVATRARQAVANRRQVVVQSLRPSSLRNVSVIDLGSHPVADAADTAVSSAAMTRYHRAGCLLAAGKPVAPASRRSHEAAGRRPCGVCTP